MSGWKERGKAIVAESLILIGGLRTIQGTIQPEVYKDKKPGSSLRIPDINKTKRERLSSARRTRKENARPQADYGKPQKRENAANPDIHNQSNSGELRPGETIVIIDREKVYSTDVIKTRGYPSDRETVELEKQLEQIQNGRNAFAGVSRFMQNLGAENPVIDSLLALAPVDLVKPGVLGGMVRGAIESAGDELNKVLTDKLQNVRLSADEAEKLLNLDPGVLQKLGLWEAVRGDGGLTKAELNKSRKLIQKTMQNNSQDNNENQQIPYQGYGLLIYEAAALGLVGYGIWKKDNKIISLGLLVAFAPVGTGILTACGTATPDNHTATPAPVSTSTDTQIGTATATAGPTVIIDSTPGVPVSTETVTNTTPTPTPEIGSPTGWNPPNLEDMGNVTRASVKYDQAGKWVVSGENPVDIQASIDSIDKQLAESNPPSVFRFKNYYDAVMKIPGAVSAEMVVSGEGRWILVPRDAKGQIIWQVTANGLVPEFPYNLEFKSGISVVGAGTEGYFVSLPPGVPDVVWAGEKAIAVGDKVNINGEEVYRRYWDPKDNQIKPSNQPDVVKALLGADLNINVVNLPADSIKQAGDGSWSANVDGKNYVFDASGKWVEEQIFGLDGVASDVYTFKDFETRQITFDELPFIDKATLDADDLSDVKVDSSAMAKAIPVQKSVAHIRSTNAVFTFETRLDPNHLSYIDDPETRPFKAIRAFRTKVDGRDLPGAIVLVKNSDNSITKLKVLFASDFAKPANVKFLNEQFDGGPATDWEPMVMSAGLSPAMMPMNLKGDEMNVTIGEFHVTPAELEEIKKLMIIWQESGNAPPELGKYVINLLPVVWTP